jgi:hypothetical protein
MKYGLLIPLFTIVMLGCSVTAPFAGPAPAPEVAFRMPRDMNLQPQDVPGLMESPVENPASDLMLPEALGQDQRFYTSRTQDIRIESNFILLPEPTGREPSELLEEVLHHRQPAAILEAEENPIALGAMGWLWRIQGLCSPGQGTGLSLVVIRQNVAAVLLGCGSGATQDYMQSLGKAIEARVTAPPGEHEITWGSSQAASGNADDAAARQTAGQPPECAQLNLTPQERANCGTHSYWHEYETTGGGCPRSYSENYGTEPHTILFEKDAIRFPEESITCQKSGPNSYTCPGDDWDMAVGFDDYGYSLDLNWSEQRDCVNHEPEHPGDACGCNGHNEYSLEK